jgi:hypothetical protein
LLYEPHDAQYLITIATANAALVFAKAHIEHPMHRFSIPQWFRTAWANCCALAAKVVMK